MPDIAPAPRLLRRLTILTLVVMVMLVIAMQGLADRWWPATVLMFSPRWPWALPLVVLVPWTLVLGRRGRRLWGPLGASAALWLFGVLGFNVPTAPAAWGLGDDRGDLRVASYNMGEVRATPAALARILGEIAPDVMTFQECDPEAVKGLAPLGWQVATLRDGCMVSRHRILRAEQRDEEAIWKLGGSGVYTRYVIEVAGRPVSIVSVHLETVRKGLNELIANRGLAGGDAMNSNLAQRDIESLLGRAWARETPAPAVITGDFNMPVESALYRRDWSDFTNAFHRAGWGTGASKHTRWHGVRIDHVLVGEGWDVARAWVGPDIGGDHSPMVAELRWVGGVPAAAASPASVSASAASAASATAH